MFKVQLHIKNQKMLDVIVSVLSAYCVYEITDKDPDIFIADCDGDDNLAYCTDNMLSKIISKNARDAKILYDMYTLSKEAIEELLGFSGLPDCPVILLRDSINKIDYDTMVEFVCHGLFIRFNIDNLYDEFKIIRIHDINTSEEIKKMNNRLRELNGKSITSLSEEANVPSEILERVKDSKFFKVELNGTIAYETKDIAEAIKECDKRTGYYITDDTNKRIYESKKARVQVKDKGEQVITQQMIVRCPSGIKIKTDRGYVNIVDGTKCTVLKYMGRTSKISVIIDKKRYTPVILSQYLSSI